MLTDEVNRKRSPVSFHPKMAYGATFHKSGRALEDEGPAFVYTA